MRQPRAHSPECNEYLYMQMCKTRLTDSVFSEVYNMFEDCNNFGMYSNAIRMAMFVSFIRILLSPRLSWLGSPVMWRAGWGIQFLFQTDFSPRIYPMKWIESRNKGKRHSSSSASFDDKKKKAFESCGVFDSLIVCRYFVFIEPRDLSVISLGADVNER